MKVLIVDDDRWFAESLRDSLADPYEVGMVQQADDIFPALEQFAPDVLLLDLILAEQNAITFLNELASYDDLSQLRIIVLSSAAKDAPQKALRELGAEAVLDKAEATPAQLKELIGE